jgi:hypothetical protein
MHRFAALSFAKYEPWWAYQVNFQIFFRQMLTNSWNFFAWCSLITRPTNIQKRLNPPRLTWMVKNDLNVVFSMRLPCHEVKKDVLWQGNVLIKHCSHDPNNFKTVFESSLSLFVHEIWRFSRSSHFWQWDSTRALAKFKPWYAYKVNLPVFFLG